MFDFMIKGFRKIGLIKNIEIYRFTEKIVNNGLRDDGIVQNNLQSMYQNQLGLIDSERIDGIDSGNHKQKEANGKNRDEDLDVDIGVSIDNENEDQKNFNDYLDSGVVRNNNQL